MSFRHIFQQYIDNPDTCRELVLYEDEHVLIIKDMFPKSLRHYLVVPRSGAHTRQHPLDVFRKDLKFYDLISDYVDKAKQLIVESLVAQELIEDNHHKAQEFKNTFIQAGVHSIPSLSNLHIHVMTKDFYSPRMKHKKHYNSFNTSFFVDFDDLEPLEMSHDDYFSDQGSDYSTGDESSGRPLERDAAALENIIKSTPLTCRYCMRTFGNSFAKLKGHLEEEFHKHFDVSKNCAANA